MARQIFLVISVSFRGQIPVIPIFHNYITSGWTIYKKTYVWSLLISSGYGIRSKNPFSRTMKSLRIINLFCKIACQKCPIFCFLNKNKNKILPVSEMVKYYIFILFVLVKTERTFFFFLTQLTEQFWVIFFCDLVVNYFYFLLLKVLKNSVHVSLWRQYIFLVCS